MSEDKSKLQLIGEIAQANNKNLELIEELNDREEEIEKLHSIIKEVREYIEEHIRIDDVYPDYMEMRLEEYKELFEILDKGE